MATSRKISKKNKVVGIILGVVIGVGFLVFCISMGMQSDSDRAAADAEAPGVITEHKKAGKPTNYFCEFTFTVDGDRYTGVDGCHFADYPVGKKITVNYVPGQPDKSYLGGDVTAKEARSDWLPTTALLLGFTVVMGGIAFLIYRTIPRRPRDESRRTGR